MKTELTLLYAYEVHKIMSSSNLRKQNVFVIFLAIYYYILNNKDVKCPCYCSNRQFGNSVVLEQME